LVAGRVINLGIPPGATIVQSFGINNRGEVVGYTDLARSSGDKVG
jgi:hypothetical protein